MTPKLFDDRRCVLGEGPLWHPLRRELLWVDIEDNRLLGRRATSPGPTHGSRPGGDPMPSEASVDRHFTFKPSALGWIDQNRLLMGTDGGLYVYDLSDQSTDVLCLLEDQESQRRSNDGRADPWGGFWISTMTHDMDPGQGRIYRWYQGEIRLLVEGLACPNAICFAPDRSVGYFADSMPGEIRWHPLDPQTGWPTAAPQVFAKGLEGAPDGAVTAQDGTVWNAEWGQGRLLAFAATNGAVAARFDLPARQLTCPAIDPETGCVFVTSAAVGLDDPRPEDGQTFVLDLGLKGVPEPAVRL